MDGESQWVSNHPVTRKGKDRASMKISGPHNYTRQAVFSFLFRCGLGEVTLTTRICPFGTTPLRGQPLYSPIGKVHRISNRNRPQILPNFSGHTLTKLSVNFNMTQKLLTFSSSRSLSFSFPFPSFMFSWRISPILESHQSSSVTERNCMQ